MDRFRPLLLYSRASGPKQVRMWPMWPGTDTGVVSNNYYPIRVGDQLHTDGFYTSNRYRAIEGNYGSRRLYRSRVFRRQSSLPSLPCIDVVLKGTREFGAAEACLEQTSNVTRSVLV